MSKDEKLEYDTTSIEIGENSNSALYRLIFSSMKKGEVSWVSFNPQNYKGTDFDRIFSAAHLDPKNVMNSRIYVKFTIKEV